MTRTEALRHYQSTACSQHAHINIKIAGKSQASLTKNYRLLINAENAVLLREKVRPAMIAAPQQLAFAGAAAGHNAHAGRLRNIVAAELLLFAHLGSDNRHCFSTAVGQKGNQLAGNAVFMDKNRRSAKIRLIAHLTCCLRQSGISIFFFILYKSELVLFLLCY